MDYTKSMLGRNLIKIMKAVKLMARPGGATIAALMDQLETSRRSVYRLFETMQELNFPIYEEYIDGRTKSWHLQEDFLIKLPNLDFPDISLTRKEVLVLYLLISRGNILRDTEINHYLPSLQKKLSSYLPMNTEAEKLRRKIDHVFIPVYQGIKYYSGKEELINDMMSAITDQRTCRALYHSFSQDKVHTIAFNPLKIFEWNGGIYSFIQFLPDKPIRTIALERIRELTVTEDRFNYPEDFNPEAMLSSALTITFGDPIHVKVWFDSHQANYIRERRWAKDQSITEQDDGSIILAMSTSGYQDVKRWIMSIGPYAKVLEPEFMAQEIEQDIRKIQSLYDL
ncbi:hypothetical protein ES705_39495 [subsurface metagenome]